MKLQYSLWTPLRLWYFCCKLISMHLWNWQNFLLFAAHTTRHLWLSTDVICNCFQLTRVRFLFPWKKPRVKFFFISSFSDICYQVSCGYLKTSQAIRDIRLSGTGASFWKSLSVALHQVNKNNVKRYSWNKNLNNSICNTMTQCTVSTIIIHNDNDNFSQGLETITVWQIFLKNIELCNDRSWSDWEAHAVTQQKSFTQCFRTSCVSRWSYFQKLWIWRLDDTK